MHFVLLSMFLLRRNVMHSLFLMLWIHFNKVLVCGKGERGNILGVIFAVGKYSGIGVS